MNELANGLGNAPKELAIGASDEVVKELFDYFTKKGRHVVCLDEDHAYRGECDIILYQLDWEKGSVYLSPFDPNGYCPNVVISLNYLSDEKLFDQIKGFLEAIGF